MKKLLLLYLLTIIGINMAYSQSKTGICKTFYENGKVKSEEIYKNGVKAGICKYYYENGKLQYEECYDGYGQKEGTYRTYYKNGQLESSYTYKDGQKHGIFKEFLEDGKLRNEGKYENGELSITDEEIEERRKSNTYAELDQKPQFKGGEGAMLRFIGANLKYPTVAVDNNLQGTVTVRFVVSNTGDIKNVEVVKGFHILCEKEAVRVVKMMPKWIPAKYKGQNVSVYYSLPIKFRLTN